MDNQSFSILGGKIKTLSTSVIENKKYSRQIYKDSVNGKLTPSEKSTQNSGKLLDSFSSITGWSVPASGLVTLDITNFTIGNSSIKLAITADSTYRAMTKDIGAFTRENRTTLGFDIFVGALTNSSVVVYFGNADFSKYISMQFTGLVLGWNKLSAPLSAFTLASATTINDTFTCIRFTIPSAVTGDNISVTNLRLYKTIKPKMVICLDDGYVSQYAKIFPLLKSKGVVASLAIQGNKVGTTLTIPQIQEMVNYGFETLNHTFNHVSLAGVSIQTIYNELNLCNEVVKDNFNTDGSLIVAYPNGSYDATLISEMKKLGYVAGRITNGLTQKLPIPAADRYKINSIGFAGVYTTDKIVVDTALGLNNSIVWFMHDLSDTAIDALGQIIDYAITNGFECTTMSRLLMEV